MTLNILFLTQYYPPETGAAQSRLWNLAHRLADRGHKVSVVTAVPSYPRGKIFQEYVGKLLYQTTEGPVHVVRTWCYATKSTNFILRIVNYFSFVATSLLFATWKIPDQDFVIVESPPLFLGIAGLVLSWVKRSRLVMNVSDLWPESAIALGVIKEGFVSRYAVRFEEYLYRNSAFITAQSTSIVDNIAGRTRSKKVVYLPNGVSPETILGEESKKQARCEVRARLKIRDGFVVGYTGLHGLAQGLTTILEAAAILTTETRISFALIGDGPDKESLISIVKDRGLTNVSFYPSQAAAEMPYIFAALDVAIVPLRRHRLFAGVLPSKLFEAMGAGVPVIFSGEGEPGQVVKRARAGICVEPENPAAMADAIIGLFRNPELCRLQGVNASRYVLQNFNRANIAAKLDSILMDEAASLPDQGAPGEVPEKTDAVAASSND
jgi:glycosyltransferase involved in cell wall biosynthesis